MWQLGIIPVFQNRNISLFIFSGVDVCLISFLIKISFRQIKIWKISPTPDQMWLNLNWKCLWRVIRDLFDETTIKIIKEYWVFDKLKWGTHLHFLFSKNCIFLVFGCMGFTSNYSKSSKVVRSWSQGI